MKKNPIIILLRHGQSVWNKANIFTGWIDIPLSSKGIEESLEAGRKIKNIPIDAIFTSTLIRAQMTAMLAMSVKDGAKTPVILHDGEGKLEEWSKDYGNNSEILIPVYRAWQLNERMYGQLQGLNKDAMREKFGADQVQLWRRSYDISPPDGESLQMTAARTIPYFSNEILPFLQQGKNVLIAAHGNSLRSIVMQIDGLSPQQVLELEIETGNPIAYTYAEGTFLKEKRLV